MIGETATQSSVQKHPSRRHWFDWYVLQAVATAEIASKIVERISTRCSLPPSSFIQENTLTARAITRPTTVSAISDCSAIVNFAQRAIGMTSVGLKAVLVVKPRIR